MKKTQLNRIFFIAASILVLGTGTFLITEDFYKEQIKIWDEASGAKNAIDMLKNGNWLVQYDEGEPVRDDFKPPLTLWFKIISYKLFGINEFSVRLPSIAAALLTMFLLWYFGSFVLKKPELGILSALLLISSRGYVTYHVARTGDPDSILIFFVTGAILSFFVLLYKYPKSIHKYLLLFTVFTLLSIYTKSIMGIAPFAGVAIYTIFDKNGRKLLLNYKFYVSILIIALITSVYYIVRELIDPGYLKGVLEYEILVFNHHPDNYFKHPEFSFYFKYLMNEGFKPFIYFVPVSVIVYFISKVEKINKKLISYTFLVVFLFVLGMSFSYTKNEWYIASVYPFLALLTASGISGIAEIINNKIKKYEILITYLIIVLIGFIAWNPVNKIYKRNHKYQKSTYIHEREGKFLKQCKHTINGLTNIIAVKSDETRQLEFYKKKFNYDDGTKTKIINTLSNNLIGDTILVCESTIIDSLLTLYRTHELIHDKYCKLLYVIENKDSNLFDTVKWHAEGFPIYDRIDTICTNNYSFGKLFYSKKYSFSGDSSVLTSPKHRFSFTVEFKLKQDKNIIKATVWRKKKGNNGFLVFTIPTLKVYKQTEKVIKEKNGWEQIQLHYIIPSNYKDELVKIYVWNNSKHEIYFDDLEIIMI